MNESKPKKKSDLQGEGNYDAAREYDEQATSFAQDRDKVKDAAQRAKRAVESPEGEKLEEAEEVGRSHARK